MVKEMFCKVGVSGKTNHSWRATGASALFQAKVPEKIIQERTGHRSVKAVRLYERTTEQQHHQVSNILSSRMQQQPISWQNRCSEVHRAQLQQYLDLECCRTVQSTLTMGPVQ